jgi:PhnB protein
MRFQPELAFDGECEAAFELYARCFGGAVTTLLRYGDSPMAASTAPALHAKIAHATLTVGDVAVLSGADVAAEAFKQPAGFDVLVTLSDPAEAERIFSILAEGGTVQLPMQQTFWALRFGMVVDRFGTPWKINCGKPA